MRICFVSYSAPPVSGGLQTYVKELAVQMNKRGHDITLYTNVTETGDLDDVVDVVREPGHYLSSAPLPSSIRQIMALSRVPETYSELSRIVAQSDIVHVCSPHLLSYVAQLAADRAGVPSVLSLHGRIVDRPDFPLHRRVPYNTYRRLCLQQANEVFVANRGYADITTRYVPRSKIRPIPNGIDTNTFTADNREQARRNLSLQSTGQLIVSVNRLMPINGVQFLIDALPAVFGAHPEAECLLIGGGQYRSALEERTQTHAIESRVQFVGDVPRKDVFEYLHAADVAVFPFGGISCLEALSVGCPTVASLEPITIDMIGLNERGRLADILPYGYGYHRRDVPDSLSPNKTAELADQITWMLDNPERARELADAAREYAVSTHDWDVVVEQIADAYRNLIESYS